MLTTVLFDLDDTIFDFRRAEACALRQTLCKLNIAPSEQVISRYSEINTQLWSMLEEKKITRECLLIDRFRILLKEFHLSCPAEQAKKLYEDFIGCKHYFIPGAQELLEVLYPDYPLYIVSNGTASIQDRRIASAGISHYFQEIFISQRIGFDKPHINFFNHCFEKIPNFSKEHTIIIGDSLTSDIRGGNQAGIHTCWFNPHQKPVSSTIIPDYTISSLNEIPNLLHSIS